MEIITFNPDKITSQLKAKTHHSLNGENHPMYLKFLFYFRIRLFENYNLEVKNVDSFFEQLKTNKILIESKLIENI